VKLLILLSLIYSVHFSWADEKVDLILFNGTVFTSVPGDPLFSQVAIREGKIVAVGGQEISAIYLAKRRMDLKGHFLIPGFIDTHLHTLTRSKRFVSMEGVESIVEIRERLQERAKKLKSGNWLTAFYWFPEDLKEGRFPNRDDIDLGLESNPVVLGYGHLSVVNSKALEIAGIDDQTPDPKGGKIERDSQGRATGILIETARGLVGKFLPDLSDEEYKNGILESLREALTKGITSYIDANTGLEKFGYFKEFHKEFPGTLPKISAQIRIPGNLKEARPLIEAAAELKTLDDEWVRVGAMKMFVDGGFTSGSAWTLAPYKGRPDYFGIQLIEPVPFKEIASVVHDAGLQMGFHAIGDAAIQMVVNAWADILTETPREDHRHYLNHFTVLPPSETLEKMSRFQIGIAQQPNFTYRFEGRYQEHLEGQSLEQNNSIRTPIDYGIFMAFGTDNYPSNPLFGLHSAVTRMGKSGRVYGPYERIGMADAITRYTRNGAYLTFEEKMKGTIEPGKSADLVVLAENLLEISHEKIHGVKVLKTFLNGKIVYQPK